MHNIAIYIACIFILFCKSYPNNRNDIFLNKIDKKIDDSYLRSSKDIIYFIKTNDFNNFIDCLDKNLLNSLWKVYSKTKKFQNKEQFKQFIISKMENREEIPFVSNIITFIQNDKLYKTEFSLAYRLSGPDIKDEPVYIFIQVNNLEGFIIDPSQDSFLLYGIALNEEKHIIDIVNFQDENDKSFLEYYQFD